MPNKKREQERGPVEWDFFSFPVFFAFCVGLLISSYAISIELGGSAGIVHTVLSLGSLFGVTFSIAHIATSVWRRGRVNRARAREEEAERERRALAARARREARAQTLEGEAPAEAPASAAPPARRRKRRRRAG